MIGKSRLALPSGNFRGSLLHEGTVSDEPSSNLTTVVPSVAGVCAYLRWLVWQTTQ